MEYGKVFRRAWQITWQWKILWVLGFVASLGRGVGGLRDIFSPFSWPGLNALLEAEGATNDIGTGAACGMIDLGIALWAVSTITWGGLIAAVWQVEDEGSTSFGWAWQVVATRFWTLVGIGILTAVPLIVMALIVVAVGVSDGVGVIVAVGLAVVAWLVWLIQVYAQRAAILEGLGWIEAFKQGWQVLRANIGPTLVLGLIFLVIGTIVGEVEATLGRLITGAVTSTDEGASASVAAYAGTLLAILLGALIGSVVNTFSSVTWTLVYRDLVSAGHRRSPRGELEPRAPDHSAPGIDETRKRPSKRKRHKKHSAAQVPVFSIAVAGL